MASNKQEHGWPWAGDHLVQQVQRSLVSHKLKRLTSLPRMPNQTVSAAMVGRVMWLEVTKHPSLVVASSLCQAGF